MCFSFFLHFSRRLARVSFLSFWCWWFTSSCFGLNRVFFWFNTELYQKSDHYGESAGSGSPKLIIFSIRNILWPKVIHYTVLIKNKRISIAWLSAVSKTHTMLEACQKLRVETFCHLVWIRHGMKWRSCCWANRKTFLDIERGFSLDSKNSIFFFLFVSSFEFAKWFCQRTMCEMYKWPMCIRLFCTRIEQNEFLPHWSYFIHSFEIQRNKDENMYKNIEQIKQIKF